MVIPECVLEFQTNWLQFELLRRNKSGKCIGNFETDSIPSAEEARVYKYDYMPCRPIIGKLPIQPHIFMHYFQDPGDHIGSLAVDRLPKKLDKELSCDDKPPIGWGIYIYNRRLQPGVYRIVRSLDRFCFYYLHDPLGYTEGCPGGSRD